MTDSPPTSLSITPIGRREVGERLNSFVDCYFAAYGPIPEYGYDTREEVETYLGWMLDRDPSGLYIAEQHGEMAGWCGVTGAWRGWRNDLKEPIGELQELVVDPRWQGHGLGRRFLATAIDHSRRAGRSTIGLWVGEHNERAKSLYAQNGFVEASRWNIWIRMTRPLVDEV